MHDLFEADPYHRPWARPLAAYLEDRFVSEFGDEPVAFAVECRAEQCRLSIEGDELPAMHGRLEPWLSRVAGRCEYRYLYPLDRPGGGYTQTLYMVCPGGITPE